MSEAAEIIFAALRSFDCPLPKDVASFDSFGPEDTVAVTAKCLNLIEPDSPPLKLSLPKNLASRHRACAALGKRLKDCGFPGECGYNQFLYPNWRDVKEIFTFLVGKVPKGGDEAESAVGGSSAALLQNSIQSTLKNWRKDTWVPPFCNVGRGFGHRLRTSTIEFVGPRSKYLVPSVDRQVRKYETDIGPSLLEKNQMMLLKQREQENLDNTEETRLAKSKMLASLVRRAFDGVDPTSLAMASGNHVTSNNSKMSMNDLLDEMMGGGDEDGSNTAFSHATDFAQDKLATTAEAAAIAAEAEADKEEEAKQERLRREEELDNYQNQLRDIMNQIMNENKKRERDIGKTKQLENELIVQLGLRKELEAEYKLKKKTLDLLPNANENMNKLKKICDESGLRLLELASEWEKHRVPLINALRDIKQGMSRRKLECKWKVSEIKRMREEMRSMANSIRTCEERHKQLLIELEKMPKNINRAVYTYRILDIIKQIRKQKREIANIINDIRQVQKETNQVGATLARQEQVTDDHVYKAASKEKGKDGAYVKSYKLLTKIRERFDDMVSGK
jgi:coiled-coil domain-containing protein 22